MQVPPDHVLRAAYEAELRALCRRGAETACLLALPLVPAFAVIDYAVFPEQARFFLGIRIACVAVITALYALLRSPAGSRNALPLGVLVATVTGLMVDVLTVYTGREASPYYAGVNLVQLAVALLLPWGSAWTVFTCAVLVGGYVVLTLATGPIVQGRMFVNNLAFLSSTSLITVVSSALRERLQRREFFSRTALAEALRHKSEFLAKMSHELRTPLHVMIGYADILLEEALGTDGAEARRLLGRMRSSGVLLHRMISDLLDYSKVEAGKMEVHAGPVRVNEIIERVADTFRPLADRKGLDLAFACAADLPELVSDGQKLERILINLVGNAVKFTERGAVRIEARPVGQGDAAGFTDMAFLDPPDTADRVTARPPAGLAILVSDTGIGIRREDLARLAGDFQQVDGTAERYGGTGLGLSISRKLAQLLGGRIAVRSRYDEGTLFALFLPAPLPRWRVAA